MRMTQFPAIVFLTGLALLLLRCSPTSPSGISASFLQSETTYTYSIEPGGLLVISAPMQIDETRSCEGNSLVVEYDTIAAATDTSAYDVTGDTLRIYNGDYSDAFDTLQSSGAVVSWFMLLVRTSSGSGIQGTWQAVATSYDVVSGAPTPSEFEELNADTADENFLYRYYKITVEFGTNQMTVRLVEGSYSWADIFVEYWNSPLYGGTADSARYDITVTKASRTEVQLTGNVTHETVTITRQYLNDAEYSETYSSSSTSDSSYTYYSNPRSCPNELSPAWYSTFLNANLKNPGLARRTSAPRPGKARFSPFVAKALEGVYQVRPW